MDGQRELRRQRKVPFNGEGLVDELLVEVLLILLDHDHSDTFSVELRAASAAHHLKHIGHGEVDIAVSLCVEVL